MICEDVPLRRIAEAVGTPVYVYSRATLSHHYKVFDSAFAGIPHVVCYSMKANSNGSVIRTFTSLGSGADVVSGGELARALAAGAPPSKIVYSGVGKQVREIEEAIRRGILMFNVESREELETIDAVAGRMRKRAPIALRVNPDVDPKTHPYISTGLKQNKFGIPIGQALKDYEWAGRRKHIEVVGIDCHIGSQLTEIAPFVDAAARIRILVERLLRKGLPIRLVDIGGGLGIPYDEELPPQPKQYAEAILRAFSGLDVTLVLEPGRVLVGNAGVLLTRLLYTKESPSRREKGGEEALLHRGCRDERPCPPFPLRIVSRHRSRGSDRAREGHGRRGRSDLRVGGLPREGPEDAGGPPGGSPRGHERRRVRVLDVLQLQLASAGGGGDGLGGPVRGRPGAGIDPGSRRRRENRVVSGKIAKISFRTGIGWRRGFRFRSSTAAGMIFC
jgi:diaminopimelate decarboxylase